MIPHWGVPSSGGPATFRSTHTASTLRTEGSMSAATSPSDSNVVAVSVASDDRSLATCKLLRHFAPPRACGRWCAPRAGAGS